MKIQGERDDESRSSAGASTRLTSPTCSPSTFVLATEAIDRVLVIPTYKHPFAKPLAPYDDRVEMCALAMGWLPRVEVSRVEEELGGESRTLRTLEHLQAAHPDWSMRLAHGGRPSHRSAPLVPVRRDLRDRPSARRRARVGVETPARPRAVSAGDLEHRRSCDGRRGEVGGAGAPGAARRARADPGARALRVSVSVGAGVKSVFILGAGKVGRALAHALRAVRRADDCRDAPSCAQGGAEEEDRRRSARPRGARRRPRSARARFSPTAGSSRSERRASTSRGRRPRRRSRRCARCRPGWRRCTR